MVVGRGLKAACLGLSTSFAFSSGDLIAGIPAQNYALPWGVNDCFVQPSFYEDSVVVQRDIPYTTVFDDVAQKDVTLLLDVYSPPDIDTRTSRPAIVLMHGGAFVYNSKTDDIPPWATQAAAHGYVVLSIDYRLSNIGALMADPMKEVAAASNDARAAVRFLRSMAAEWRVDTSRIALGGGSAGAIAALYTGYMPEMGREAEESDEDLAAEGPSAYSSAVSGVISLSGEMKMQIFCGSIDPVTYAPSNCNLDAGDLTNMIVSNSVPVVAVHGTADPVIPYVNGRALIARAQAVGVRSELVTAVGVPHMPESTNFMLGDTQARNTVYTFISGMLNLAQAECPVKQVLV